MEAAPENGKESSHSAHAKGVDVCYIMNLTYEGSNGIYMIGQSNRT